MADRREITLTGTSASTAIDLTGSTIVEIEVPGEWDAADLLFLSSYTAAGTFRELYDANGDRLRIRIDDNRNVTVDPRLFQSIRHLKMVASASQGSTRTLYVLTERLSHLMLAGKPL